MVFCVNCGTQLTGRFCAKCGIESVVFAQKKEPGVPPPTDYFGSALEKREHYENTLQVNDKDGDVTFLKVEDGWIKIGQNNEHNDLEWEERRDILVNYASRSREGIFVIIMQSRIRIKVG
jgi:hypothetical protein